MFHAPDVFGFRGREALEYDCAPEPTQVEALRRARAACPVQAIGLGPSLEEAGDATAR